MHLRFVVSLDTQINARQRTRRSYSRYRSRIAGPNCARARFSSLFLLLTIGGPSILGRALKCARTTTRNGINEHTCGPRARVHESDVCDARRAARCGLTRACIREGMLNRCAASSRPLRACAHALPLPCTTRGFSVRVCNTPYCSRSLRKLYPSSSAGRTRVRSLTWRYFVSPRRESPCPHAPAKRKRGIRARAKVESVRNSERKLAGNRYSRAAVTLEIAYFTRFGIVVREV